MIHSMTGFGRAELRFDEGTIRVEIKTVNHKFLEISSRLPGHLAEHEDMVRRVIGRKVRRGKVNLFILSPDPAAASGRIILNERLAKEVYAKIRRLGRVLGMRVDDQAALREVVHYPDVLVKEAGAAGVNPFARHLEKVLTRALESLTKSRRLEGNALGRDLKNRIDEIRRALAAIERRIPALAGDYRRSLERRMRELMPAAGSGSEAKNGGEDRERMTLEIAQYVKNSDVSEEVTRLKSHLDVMRRALSESGEVGRKIDFIAQEMMREANTLGAKCTDAAVTSRVIDIKSAVEKIREQAQNVE